jgi:hypothetical protein
MNHPIHADYSLETLVVKAPAKNTTADILETIDRLEEFVNETKFDKVLLDLTDVTSIPPLVEMFEITLKIPRRLWVAGLIEGNERLEADFEFAETVAKNRGMSLRIFRSRKDAVEWLQSF